VYGSRGRASFASAAPSGIVSLGGLAARSGSCIDESALNAVPFDGGVDLFEDKAVLDFFTTSTGNLLAAEKTAGVAIMLRCPSSARNVCRTVTPERSWRRRS
jgi:hypothetical protein